MFLGAAKREWDYLCKRAEFPPDIQVKTEGFLAEMYLLNSTEELERAEQGIRDGLIGHLENNIQPEIFSRFKDTLLSQDEKLSKLLTA